MRFLPKIKASLVAALGGLLTLLLFLLIIIFNAAELSSCFYTPKSKKGQVVKEMIAGVDSNNMKHKKIVDRFYKIATSDNPQERRVDIRFTKSDEPIAASLGDGNFLFSESVSDLPSWIIDGIIAHELAHDYLMHVRRSRDVDDLRRFIVDILSLHSEQRTTDTLQVWSKNIVLPQYSKSQELEADDTAIAIMLNNGVDNAPSTYRQVLEYLKGRYGESGGGFFDAHPSLSERIKNIDQIMENIPAIEMWECRGNNCVILSSPGTALKEVWIDLVLSGNNQQSTLKTFLFVPKDWERSRTRKIVKGYKNTVEADLSTSVGKLQPFQQANNYKVFEILDK